MRMLSCQSNLLWSIFTLQSNPLNISKISITISTTTVKTISIAVAPQAAPLRTAADEITIWLGINVGIHNLGIYEITSDNKNIYLHKYITSQHVCETLTVTPDLCVTVTRMPCLQRG